MGGGYCVFCLDRRKRKFGNYEEELSLLRCIGVGERSGRASIQAERHSGQGTRGEGKKEDMQEEKKIKRKNRVRLSRSYVQCLEVRHNEGIQNLQVCLGVAVKEGAHSSPWATSNK